MKCSKRFLFWGNLIVNINEICSIDYHEKEEQVRIRLRETTWSFPCTNKERLDEIFNLLYEADILTPEEMSARQLEQKGL